MILCLFPWGQGVGGSVCCDREREAGEDEQVGGVRRDRGDLSGHSRAVKIAQRPLCNKGQKFKPIFALQQIVLAR